MVKHQTGSVPFNRGGIIRHFCCDCTVTASLWNIWIHVNAANMELVFLQIKKCSDVDQLRAAAEKNIINTNMAKVKKKQKNNENEHKNHSSEFSVCIC